MGAHIPAPEHGGGAVLCVRVDGANCLSYPALESLISMWQIIRVRSMQLLSFWFDMFHRKNLIIPVRQACDSQPPTGKKRVSRFLQRVGSVGKATYVGPFSSKGTHFEFFWWA